MIQIPLALDHTGELASALTAPKHVPYTCLECGGSLHVRRGEENAAHFAHTAHDTQGCSGESVIHRAAKRLLRQQLEAELAQDGHVHWVRHCPGVQAPWPRDLRALTRSQLQALQTALNQRGFASGTPDGMMGPATREGIRNFQRSEGLPADGYPDVELLGRLQQ